MMLSGFMTNKISVFALAAIAACISCNKLSSLSSGNEAGAQPTATAPTSAPVAAGAAPSAGDDLVGLASGSLVVQRAKAVGKSGEAWYLFDEDATTGWQSEAGHALEPTVIELGDRSKISSLVIDTGHVEIDARLPKEILFEVSDTSATAGFKPIATATLAAQMKDGQSFPVSAQVPGRWLRMTIKSMQEPGKDIAQIMEVRAYGERVAKDPPIDVTGTYAFGSPAPTIWHLKQEGTTVTGCFDGGKGMFTGGVEGHVLRFTYATESVTGPAIAVFGKNDMFVGYWQANSTVTEHPTMETDEGVKKSTQPGTCPEPWKPPQDALGSELKQKGRLRIYGILFDTDSDVIKPESKAAIDQVTAMLKANADVKLTVEGHTDSTSTAAHNLDLSKRRASAVKASLVKAGIDAARLDPVGLGQTKPIATNATALGRAANRRVELAKK